MVLLFLTGGTCLQVDIPLDGIPQGAELDLILAKHDVAYAAHVGLVRFDATMNRTIW